MRHFFLWGISLPDSVLCYAKNSELLKEHSTKFLGMDINGSLSSIKVLYVLPGKLIKLHELTNIVK